MGQKLIEALKDREDLSLIASGKGDSRLPDTWSDQFIWESMDITDPLAIEQVMSNHLPDYIIHTAAMTQVDDCENNKEAC